MLKHSSLLFIVLLAAVGCTPRTLLLKTTPGGDAAHGVMVSGSGEGKAAPDIARTTLGVEARADTAEQASAQATTIMNAVIHAVQAAGIAQTDLRTQNFSVGFEQDPVPPNAPQPSPLRGHYRVSNMVEVTVHDLSKVGAVLKAALDAGANNVWGVAFDLEHPEAIVAQARAQAIARAKQNAADLARLTGVTLGPIVSVSESGGGRPMPMMKAMSADAGGGVPIENGQITANLEVQLVYALPE